MYFKFDCDHCGKSLKVREELAGRKAKCPYCHGAVSVPTEIDEGPEEEAPSFAPQVTSSRSSSTAAASSRRSGSRRKARSSSSGDMTDGTNVNILHTGLIGLVAAIVLYLMLFILGQASEYVYRLFFGSPGVVFAETFLTCWAFTILAFKWRKLARQKESMLFDVLPTDISSEITQENVDKFIDHVHNLPSDPSESFLINRVLRGLQHFRVRGSNSEVAGMMVSQSEIDANSVDSSYTLLKTFIWAIPILGFIGTVIGVSLAVSGFDLSAADTEALKASLGTVTGGLGTAFDTTLLALVMSMLVMFPASSMQKSEEDLVNWVDEYCNENLIKRLNDGGGRAKSGDNKADIQKAINAAMADHHAELKTWASRLESIGSSLTNHVTKGWSKINEELQKEHKQQAALIEKEMSAALKKQTELLEQTQAIQTEIAGLQDGYVEKVQESLSGMAEGSQEVQTQVADSMREAADSLGNYFAGLERGLESLNRVLGELGEKQVVIKSEAAPRRGWSLFGGRRNGR